MHDYHPIIARAVLRLESNTPAARDALFQQARVILIDQLRIRQPTASDSEIMRERAALEDAIRKAESESGTPAAPQAKCTDGSTPGIFKQTTALANDPPSGPIKFREGHDHTNEQIETADASILCNLFGIQLLDQLMLDAARPLAPGSLRQDARTMLKWLSIEKPEEVKTKHYDQFARAVHRCIMEGQTPSGGLAPATAQPPLALDDDMRSVINRLLEREAAATFLDKALTWFAYIWISLIVTLNFVGIIVLMVGAPTLWAGIAELAETYSPFNLSLWITELVALSPGLGAVAWRDRRHFGHGAVVSVVPGLTAAVARVIGRLSRYSSSAVGALPVFSNSRRGIPSNMLRVRKARAAAGPTPEVW